MKIAEIEVGAEYAHRTGSRWSLDSEDWMVRAPHRVEVLGFTGAGSRRARRKVIVKVIERGNSDCPDGAVLEVHSASIHCSWADYAAARARVEEERAAARAAWGLRRRLSERACASLARHNIEASPGPGGQLRLSVEALAALIALLEER